MQKVILTIVIATFSFNGVLLAQSTPVQEFINALDASQLKKA